MLQCRLVPHRYSTDRTRPGVFKTARHPLSGVSRFDLDLVSRVSRSTKVKVVARQRTPIPGSPRALAREHKSRSWPLTPQKAAELAYLPLRWHITLEASSYLALQVHQRQSVNYYRRTFANDSSVIANLGERFHMSSSQVQDTISGDRWLDVDELEAFLRDPETAERMARLVNRGNLLHKTQRPDLQAVLTGADRVRRGIVGSVTHAPMDEQQRKAALEQLRVAVRSLVGVAADIEQSLLGTKDPGPDSYWIELNHLLADGTALPGGRPHDSLKVMKLTDLIRVVMTDEVMTNKEILRALQRIRPGFTPADVGWAMRRLVKQHEVRDAGYGKYQRITDDKETG